MKVKRNDIWLRKNGQETGMLVKIGKGEVSWISEGVIDSCDVDDLCRLLFRDGKPVETSQFLTEPCHRPLCAHSTIAGDVCDACYSRALDEYGPASPVVLSKIVVLIEGGLVSEIYVDNPEQQRVGVLVVDKDDEAEDPIRIFEWKGEDDIRLLSSPEGEALWEAM